MSSEDKKQHDAEVASLSERSSQSGSDDTSSGSDSDDESDGEEVNIDLSNNEYYKGMCTLLEDENGNNIVQYVDLLCDETKEIADHVKNLEHIRRDIHSIAKNFERFIELQEQFMKAQFGASVLPPAVPQTQKSNSSSHHHNNDETTHKSSRKEHRSDEQSVRTSKSHKSKH